MKKLLLLISVFSLVSCFSKESRESETPAAFQEKSSGVIYKRGNPDVIESLYGDLIKNSTELKKLEASIEELPDKLRDSLSDYHEYNSNNSRYYSTAEQHLNRIKDSVLRTRIKLLIDSSFKKYSTAIANHESLVRLIDQKQISLSDSYTVLKLIKTLAVIEEYQRKSLPSTQPLNHISKQYDKVITEVQKHSKDSIK